MPHLTEAERNQIIGLFKDSTIRNQIIETLDFSKITVYWTIQTFCEGKGLKTQSWCGHPKLLNCEYQKILKKIVQANNHQSAEQIKNKF